MVRVRLASRFGVSRDEVAVFVGSSEVVRVWLRKFADDKSRGQKRTSRDQHAADLCRYFKWLRLGKG